MKNLLSLLLLLALIGCSELRKMNNRIYEVQKQHLLQSPYKDAKRTLIKINSQKQFRLKRLPVLIKEKIFNQKELTDTLIILEDFDEICFNCSSQSMQVLYQDTLYFVERELKGNRVVFNARREKFDIASKDKYGYQFNYFELIEIRKKMNNGQNWTNNLLGYGADDCADGNHTLLTVIYPDKEIEAIYVRCWWPERDRQQFKNK